MSRIVSNGMAENKSKSPEEILEEYKPLNSIPYSELIIGKKYSFTVGNDQVEGILIRNKSRLNIGFELTKKPANNLVSKTYFAYTKTYINNVQPVNAKSYKFERDTYSDDESCSDCEDCDDCDN